MRKHFVSLIAALAIMAVLAGCGPPQPEGRATATPLTPTGPPVPTATLPPLPTASPPAAISVPENLSAGDPYAPDLGNRGYDVQHYTLELALDPEGVFVAGKVTIEAISTMDHLDQVSLDFVGFEIGEVSFGGSPLPFFRHEGKLIVGLPEPLAKETPVTLQVLYSGQPIEEASVYVPFVSHLGLHFRPDDNSMFVVAEPDGARYWFPSNDHPRDKATFRFELTVPEGLTGVANGVLVEKQQGVAGAFPDGRAGDLYVWEHGHPMATAFATVAVGDYVRIEGTSPGGVPLRHYVFPDVKAEMEQVNPTIGEMIDWLSERLGAYPFEAFGFVMVTGLGGALETQTMVILDRGAIDDEMMLIHEMAHMWFGDWVSLDSWGDMWRSEGFATYIQYLWETRADPTELELIVAQLKQFVTDSPSGYPLNDPPSRELFGRDSYLKGAVLAHALRLELGDEAFFAGLRAYFARYGGGTATHADFQAVMEVAGGVSLDDFFAEWFKGQ